MTLENTIKTLEIAIEEAKKYNTDIVLATTKGECAKEIAKLSKELNYTGRVVVVTHAYGFSKPGENTISRELREELKQMGLTIVTSSHVLSGAERGISNKYHGVYPVQIIADSLRMLSQGVKVCVEISVMALDAGEIDYGKPVVCVGGTGRGADTVCIVTPAHANHILDTRINAIVTKPF